MVTSPKTVTCFALAETFPQEIASLTCAPDSHGLAFVETADNQFDRIRILDVASGKSESITSDRYNSENPAWSSDGKWIYFLSDRMLKTTIQSPWGPRQPDPHFDHTMKVYELALEPGLRSPFEPADELHPETSPKSDETKSSDGKKAEAKDKSKKPPEVKIDFTRLDTRLEEVPVPAGNYSSLQAADKRLCWLNASDDTHTHLALECFDIDNKGEKPDTILPDVRSYDISLDRKKMIVRKENNFYVIETKAKSASLKDPKALAKLHMDLTHWTWATTPRAGACWRPWPC